MRRMKTMLDVLAILKRYGTYIYTGNRMGDLELIEDEIKELYNSKMLEVKEFQSAILIIRHEMRKVKEGN